ncbi:MAG: exosortase C-terminal domain/associated protein EpsI [Planctomycetota bacterium]
MNRNRFFVSLIALFLTLGSVIYLSGRPLPEVVEKRLDNLPYTIGPWEGKDFSFDKLIIDELATDDRVARNYIDRNNNYIITLYIGYYGTKKGGRTGHNPNSCYPSSGWNIISDTSTNVNEGHGSVNRLLVKKGDTSQIVYHWYQDGDKIIQSGIEQNINRFINKVRLNRDDGAFVRISIDGRSEGAEETLIQFGRLLMPLIAENWPVEKEI